MKIERFIGGSLLANGYVIYQRSGGECYIIDPGYTPRRYVDFVNKNELTPAGIILTHLHSDHAGAADALRDAFGCPVYMHSADACVYRGHVDKEIDDGFVFDLEDEKLRAISTPGHTKGSICLLSEKSRVCFTGDTLFDTDLGRSDLAGGSESDMKHTICDVVDKWDNDIFIFPGHEDGCNMKNVRKYNSEFLALRDGHER